MTISVLLDPRQKLEYYLDDIDTDKLEERRAKSKELEEQLLETYNTYRDAATPRITVQEQSVNPIFKKRKSEIVQDEIKTYLYDTAMASFSDSPLQWWKINHTRYPVLAKMARDYLAIPASSASSERTFSKAGLLITDRRTRLSSESIKACCLLQSWLKSGVI